MRETYSAQEIRYLKLLRKQYRTIQEASAEVAHLRAVLRLPKGTEHFLSDLHGEHAAFLHILHNASGVIKRKINDLYGDLLSSHERDMLSTLIYYPDEKLALLKKQGIVNEEWYRLTIYRLLEVCRVCSVKYTRKRVRDAMPRGMGALMEEMLLSDNTPDKEGYYREVMQSILETGQSDAMIIALSGVIQVLAIDRLHIIGDIFDRGPRADLILNELMNFHDVDIQWGNHDISWMGAATGNLACMCNVLRIAISYNSFDVLEDGYGINLRPLSMFAASAYRDDPCTRFKPHILDQNIYDVVDPGLVAKMHKAITVIQFKVEGQIIKRHPEYGLNHRCLLEHVDFDKGTVEVDGKTYPMLDMKFPTIDPKDPLKLTEQEAELLQTLKMSFRHSGLLHKHIKFLYSHGSMYKCCNNNLLYHGCIPLKKDGSFDDIVFYGIPYSGKALMDFVDQMVQSAYFLPESNPDKGVASDFMWYLWCGAKSPLFGKEKMTTFEHYFIEDKATHKEAMNPYYQLSEKEDCCRKILKEFGLSPEEGHIINGHVPVKLKDGETPVKAGGKLFVIDGGLSKAYQSKTGIAGYTLIFNSHHLALAEHMPFCPGKKNTPKVTIVEKMKKRIMVGDTDLGKELEARIEDLKELVSAYRDGILKEKLV